MSSVHRVSSDVSCVPSRVCSVRPGEPSGTQSAYVHPCPHGAAVASNRDTRLLVLSLPVHFRRQILELLEGFLDVLGRRLVQVVVYPPRVRPVLLQERQVRVPARNARSVRVPHTPGFESRNGTGSRAHLSLWCSSCARAFCSAAAHSSSLSGFVGAGSWYRVVSSGGSSRWLDTRSSSACNIGLFCTCARPR